MASDRRWKLALQDHRRVVETYLAGVARCPDESWQLEPAPGAWSPAALTLHVAGAYEMGCRALAGGESMRLRLPPWRAWVLRKTLLPVLITRQRFPRVRAPKEVQPDLDVARGLTRAAASRRLEEAAAAAALAFPAADRMPGAPRVTHAYFGALSPYVALRFLTAHTAHHTAGLTRLLDRSG
jgi:hypothetical protein